MDKFYDSDDDFGQLFITQESNKDTCVSLEEDNEDNVNYKTVMDPQYSDISDFEDEAREKRLR